MDRNVEVAHYNSPWSSLRLRVIQVVDLLEQFPYAGFRALSLRAWQGDETYYLIGTNCGFVGKGMFCPPEVRTTCHLHYLRDDTSTVANIQSLDINIPMNLYVVSYPI
jgi:hypothetical protein